MEQEKIGDGAVNDPIYGISQGSADDESKCRSGQWPPGAGEPYPQRQRRGERQDHEAESADRGMLREPAVGNAAIRKAWSMNALCAWSKAKVSTAKARPTGESRPHNASRRVMPD